MAKTVSLSKKRKKVNDHQHSTNRSRAKYGWSLVILRTVTVDLKKINILYSEIYLPENWENSVSSGFLPIFANFFVYEKRHFWVQNTSGVAPLLLGGVVVVFLLLWLLVGGGGAPSFEVIILLILLPAASWRM